ncbi:MAG: hypothetical protein A3G91_02180 [Omnitrophica WOR_2 bacterium RIFCSPLOWO2_12_FULL_50_9]|nr:MAG: hypothetical protein A3G91_02180 [Omnitrophica WOR_2 bacterium RIFCSPLOWO2_12_FULL_50_9]
MEIDWEEYAEKLNLEGELQEGYYEDLLGKKCVLDAACGDGALIVPLSKNPNRPSRIVGIEYSQIRLERCRKRVDPTNIEILQGDVTKLPFENELFDAVAGIYVLEHLTPVQTEAMLGEFYRVLQDKGTLVISVPNKWSYRISYWIGSKFGKTHPPTPSHINMHGYQGYIDIIEKRFKVVKVKIVGMPYIRLLSKVGLDKAIKKIWKSWSVGFIYVCIKDVKMDKSLEGSKTEKKEQIPFSYISL